MIPRSIKISGFLSYQEDVEIDFTSIHVACITGQNGAGKSAMLDAMTWALFGEARKNDESVINDSTHNRKAEVTFEFEYEKSIYKIIRTREQGKSSTVEFQIWDEMADHWRVITERSVSLTNKLICNTLHLDYRTFINVSFFLQGRADQFTKQNPTERKEVLGSILNLDQWDDFQLKTVEKRKDRSNRLEVVLSLLEQIESELSEEDQRKKLLDQLTEALAAAEVRTNVRQEAWQNAKNTEQLIFSQQDLLKKTDSQLQTLSIQMDADRKKLAIRLDESARFQENLKNEAQIEEKIIQLKQAQTEFASWNDKQVIFFELERSKNELLSKIRQEQARLSQEQKTLRQDYELVQKAQQSIVQEQQRESELRKEIESLERETTAREEITAALKLLMEDIQGKKAECLRMKNRMTEIKNQQNNLREAVGAPCPFCGTDLNEEHCRKYLAQLQDEGQTLGNAYRSLKSELDKLDQQKQSYENTIAQMTQISQRILTLEKECAPISARIVNDQSIVSRWQQIGSKRFEQINDWLSKEQFCLEERKLLEEISDKITTLQYDASAHERCRNRVGELQSIDTQYKALLKAKAALEPLKREIEDLSNRIAENEQKRRELEAALLDQKESLNKLTALKADSIEAKKQFDAAQMEENTLRARRGAAEQSVAALESLKQKKAVLQLEKAELNQLIGRLKVLEKAFSKNGIPALLIEQALPEIEDSANEILRNLTDDKMSIQLNTLRDYKDKTRDIKKETLDIIISDGFGTRDYELYSGGEAFRVNFAIRLALSKLLAKRAGARLQMLVIDEGFGSQDAEGREKLIETITAIQDSFEKILVITHLDELKDAFPSRIEVEKNVNGSQVKVIV